MGVVFEARDDRLERTVALKVLSTALSSDAEAKSRFLREGKAASALDHPNICTVYEIGEADDGSLFMAMAYIEGVPLSDMIARGPMKLSRALEIAIEVGEGLAHSHERGIIHRDIKPSNVMVADSGAVRILDFGLARFSGATQLTVSGTTLGTAAYMSPEQTTGKKVDHRADIWALGVLLYEMVSGVRPFQGDYQQALTYAIVHSTPEPVTALRTGVPVQLDHITLKALEKDPDRRYQHVDDLLVDLRALLQSSVPRVDTAMPARPIRLRSAKISRAGSVFALIAALAAIYLGMRFGTKPSVPVLRMTVETGSIPVGAHPVASPIALAPDGSRLVYEQREGMTSILMTRALDSYSAVRLGGTQSGKSPFFSPDGKWVGFMTESEVKKIDLESGDISTVAQLERLTHGATWTSDGTIVVSLTTGLAEVPAGGGRLEVFAHVDTTQPDETFLVFPEAISESDYVLATTLDGNGRKAKVWAVSRLDGSRTFLTDGGNARYFAPGVLAFPVDGSVWIAAFDTDNLSLSSTPVLAQEGVISTFAQEPSLAFYDISEQGTLAYVARRETSGLSFLTWLKQDQTIERISDRAAPFLGVRVSPDGRQIATTIPDEEGQRQTHVYDTSRDVWTALTADGDNFWPAWDEDGNEVYITRRTTKPPIMNLLVSHKLTSLNETVHLADDHIVHQMWAWLPENKGALLQRFPYPDPDIAEFDIVRKRQGSGTEPFISTARPDIHPSVSPDGRWIAYATRMGTSTLRTSKIGTEVYVRGVENEEPMIQVSRSGGWAPVWSRDGEILFFESGLGIMAVDWEDAEVPRPGPSRLFYSGPFSPSIVYGRNYDVAPGRSLVILHQGDEVSGIRVITGWNAEVERLLDAGR